jgi:hypothetical protein
VRLKHKDTGMLLSSSKDLRFGQPIHGQQEVCGVASKGKDTDWFAAEGVYLPRADGHSAANGGKKGGAAAAAAAAAGAGAAAGGAEQPAKDGSDAATKAEL